jgi:hypothetical protein
MYIPLKHKILHVEVLLVFQILERVLSFEDVFFTNKKDNLFEYKLEKTSSLSHRMACDLLGKIEVLS